MSSRSTLCFAAAALSLTSACATVRDSNGERAPFGVALETQAYPAGVIAGVRAEFPLSPSDSLTARIAWNETDRQDFGEHDDESGGGAGGGLGWRRYFGAQRDGWLLGGRVDLWALEIDWEDDSPASEGRTDVLVLQPSLEAGYAWRLGDSRWRFELTAALGVEINVDTDGEDVGEGLIGLAGFALTYEF